MSIYNRKRYLQQQISQLQEFLKLEQDHPFLLASDKARIEMLQNELDQLPDEHYFLFNKWLVLPTMIEEVVL